MMLKMLVHSRWIKLYFMLNANITNLCKALLLCIFLAVFSAQCFITLTESPVHPVHMIITIITILGVLTQNDLISVLLKILIRSTPRPCPGMCRKFTCFPFISSNQKWKRLKSAHSVTCQSRALCQGLILEIACFPHNDSEKRDRGQCRSRGTDRLRWRAAHSDTLISLLWVT